jgi:hypothetical protein
MIIIENVMDGQLWDLVFRCFSCGGLSSTPSSPPGHILPHRTLFFPPFEFPFSQTLNCNHKAVMVGAAAVERRDREIGPAPGNTPVAMNSDFLESFIMRAQELLGAEFDSLMAEADRGRRASNTPPGNPHRLMELVEMVRRSAESLQTSAPSIDAIAVAELHSALSLLERWRNHPAFKEIKRSMKDPRNFPHTIITLAAASFLLDAGNPVGLTIEPGQSGRASDLKIIPVLNSRLAIEVKAPKPLRTNPVTIDENSAREIVKKCLKKAGTGSKGQLSPEHSGLLVIGGFHLSERDFDLLERAAIGILADKGGQKSHIVAIAIFSFGVWDQPVLIDTLASPDHPPNRLGGKVLLNGVLVYRLAHNPAYNGEFKIDNTPNPQIG